MSGTPWIVLPTYNEADNLPGLVAAVRAALPEARVLVVDDNSPDGTGAVARGARGVERARTAPVKQGLGPAYVAGFAARAERRAPPYVFEMDADFSHDPADLPRLLAAVHAGADLALGSRYVRRRRRRELALAAPRRLARAAASTRAPCCACRCATSPAASSAFAPSTLRAIDYPTVRSHGYAFQVELTYRTLLAGLRVHELPIVFHERREGESKMTGRIAVEAAWLVPRLRGLTLAAGALPMRSG